MNKTILHEPLPYQAKKMQKDLLIDILRHELSVKDKRIDKAIEILNERNDECEDMWIEMKAKVYIQENNEIINILKGDEDNE